MIGQATVASSDLSPCIPESHPSDVSEYYRSVLRALHWPEPKEEGEPRDSKETFGPIRTLGVTSCARGEGVSTTAVQLAAAAAQMDEGHILLVDADLGAPSLHGLFDVDAAPGLAEATANSTALRTHIQPSGCKHLDLLTAGESRSPWWKVFDSPGMNALIGDLKQSFGLVVFDLPPANGKSATLRLAGLLDAVIIVVEAERVRYEVALRTKELLERAGAHVQGAILNKRRDYVPRWLYARL